VVPWFITQDGPVREARFKRNPNGTSDGGVHNLFVITGRSDAAGCDIAQPNFLPAGNPLSAQGGNLNIIFRIPTPVFGAGLIEAISESAIVANMKADQTLNLFSDLLVHHMGRGLADGITQGGAGPDEFRTAPLWGVGQRVFFLHDGRTSHLGEAIEAHRSHDSEANKVIDRSIR
jgi:CxxC motif-containing protein (DUF1111 family)